jgi:glucose-6-phosphate isomerase/transaldolase/glucose-6-phosphate isomerase
MIETVLADLQRRDLVARIWRKDHTVWKPDPREIADRLGWLDVTDFMGKQVPALQAFAQEVIDDGIRHVLLLGMGGSSLGPEVIRQAFGSADGFPELLVLDSTVPDAVQAVTDEIDPAKTLFLVSSKSGTTTEPLAFYSHFRGLVEEAVGKDRAGQHFAAITDPGTPLETLALERGFRRVFLNRPDIGGRYSVLSYFGLVPAALIGVDIPRLLGRADSMRDECAPFVPHLDNLGARLGATLGTQALPRLEGQGRDKLTLVTSPSIAGFGLWAEQLIAESTGKEGRGIIPVAGEPLLDPALYGDDRLFVYLRLEGDDNARTDDAIAAIESSGQPLVRLELEDLYDLGAEFFRWEFATAVAGAILGIHPFDQPNVQQAKDETVDGLKEHRRSGRLPRMDAPSSLADLISKTKPGDYLAIMAYIRQTPETDEALADLRRRVTERHHIATTLGYGPRFLHSTGQVHKGGPDSGLFLQIITDHPKEIPVPGESYTFGVLADAQAQGDLKALQDLGRRVARVRLPSGDDSEIRRLSDDVDTALSGKDAAPLRSPT